MCIAMPLVCAITSPSITVDVVIHVPRGFLKPGIQVFFNRQNGGHFDTEKWMNPVSISEFGGYFITSETSNTCTMYHMIWYVFVVTE